MISNKLQRFIDAQKNDYETALAEIKQGKKRSHWMWYIFPQIKGLGFSSTSNYYAIEDLDEATDYFNHPLLGVRLTQICNELLKLDTNNAELIFGNPDHLKLKSSLTLFVSIQHTDPVFKAVLVKYFKGKEDTITLDILKRL